MGAHELAAGMPKIVDLFARERTRAEAHLKTVTEALVRKHQDRKTRTNRFLSYIETYGLEQFEEDFIQLYRSYVLVTRDHTEASYAAWVEQRMLAGEPIAPDHELKHVTALTDLPDDLDELFS